MRKKPKENNDDSRKPKLRTVRFRKAREWTGQLRSNRHLGVLRPFLNSWLRHGVVSPSSGTVVFFLVESGGGVSVSSNPPPRSGGNSRCCCYTFCLGIKAILKVASLTPDREFQYSVRSHHGGVESAPLHGVAFRCLVLADFGRYWRLQRARAFRSNRGTLASLTPDTELITVMSTHITVVMKKRTVAFSAPLCSAFRPRMAPAKRRSFQIKPRRFGVPHV